MILLTGSSHSIIRKDFLILTGKVISKKRKQHNITQKQLGDKLGVSATTIGRYEKGELDIPSSNLPLISNYCSFQLRDYLKEWESSGIEAFIKESLSYKNLVPDNNIVNDYILSCNKEELSDLEEISYCVSAISNQIYKEAISNIIIEKHLSNIESTQHQRLIAYYNRLCKLKKSK